MTKFKRRIGYAFEYVGAGVLALLFLAVSLPVVGIWAAFRYWKAVVIAVVVWLLLATVAWGATIKYIAVFQPSGFVLRGQLDNATSDGYPYFKIGEAFIITMPKDSALVPGIRALEGKQVVITLYEDK